MKTVARPFPRLSILGLLLLLLPSLAHPAAAGIARFTAFGPPNGPILTALALPGEPGGLLLSTELGGLFWSADGGHTWAWSGLGLAGDPLQSLVADPFHPGALYGASLTAFYRSADLGQSWTAVATGQTFGSDAGAAEIQLAIAPGQRGPVFYLAAGRKLRVSHDLGVTWPAVRTEASGVAFTALAIDPQHPKTTAYAATSGDDPTAGLLRSTDTGSLWSRLALPAAFAQGIFRFAVVPTSPPVYLAANREGRLFRSTSGGTRWLEARRAGIGLGRLEADPASPGTVYAFVGYSLRVSTDAGLTWRSLGDPLPTVDHIRALALGAAQGRARGGTLYAFTDFDAYAGAPRFERWSLTLHSAFQIAGGSGNAGHIRFDVADPSIVYVILGSMVFQSVDSGASWASLAIDDPIFSVDFTDLAVDPGNDDHLLLETSARGLFGSPDRGLTWTPVSRPIPTLLELDPIDSGNLLEVDRDGLVRSTDFGVTGTRVLDSLVLKLQPDPTNREVVYALEINQSLVKSEDGGITWRTILDHGTSSFALDPAHSATLYAVQDGDLLKTTDGGATWVRVGAYPDPNALDLLVDPGAPSTLYGTSVFQGVLRSPDGGVTWVPALFTPPAIGSLENLSLFGERLYADPNVPHRIYAAVAQRLYVASF
jgi:photosystem II stability/assembly factor-like uncharacterized protein